MCSQQVIGKSLTSAATQGSPLLQNLVFSLPYQVHGDALREDSRQQEEGLTNETTPSLVHPPKSFRTVPVAEAAERVESAENAFLAALLTSASEVRPNLARICNASSTPDMGAQHHS